MRAKTSGHGAGRSASALIPRRAEREPRGAAGPPAPLVGGELLEGREEARQLRGFPVLSASHPRHGRHGFSIGTLAPSRQPRSRKHRDGRPGRRGGGFGAEAPEYTGSMAVLEAHEAHQNLV